MKTAIHHLFVNVSEICRSISFPMWMIFIILYKSCGSCRVGVAQQSSVGHGQLSGQARGCILAPVSAPWTSHICCVGENLFSRAVRPLQLPSTAAQAVNVCRVCVSLSAPDPNMPGLALGERQRWGWALSCVLHFILLLFMYVQVDAKPWVSRLLPPFPFPTVGTTNTDHSCRGSCWNPGGTGMGWERARLFKLHLVAKTLSFYDGGKPDGSGSELISPRDRVSCSDVNWKLDLNCSRVHPDGKPEKSSSEGLNPMCCCSAR